MEMVTKEQAATATKGQLLQPKGHSEVGRGRESMPAGFPVQA